MHSDETHAPCARCTPGRTLHEGFLGAACATVAAVLISWGGCGDGPTSLPPQLFGVLRVTAMDTTRNDTILITLDDQPLGRRKNPAILQGVVTGLHRVFVADREGIGSSAMVEVKRDLVTDLLVRLLGHGPYPGNRAPEFTLVTTKKDTLSLAALRGRVVLLAFFEHT